MIPGLAAAPVLGLDNGSSLREVIDALGLTSNLKLLLDAGDSASYSSGQTWTDLSGNSNNFFRGWSSGATSDDPTFNGTAGGRSSSEYFSFDGGDGFKEASALTFANDWHHDNAAFTVGAWVQIPVGVASPPALILFGNQDSATDQGVGVSLSGLASTGRLALSYTNGSSTQSCAPPTNDVVVEGSWMFCCLSFSEGSGASFVRVNSTAELLSSDSFVSPAASTPSKPYTIGGLSTASAFDTTYQPESGTRISNFMAWSTALSQAQVSSLFLATRGKFGV